MFHVNIFQTYEFYISCFCTELLFCIYQPANFFQSLFFPISRSWNAHEFCVYCFFYICSLLQVISFVSYKFVLNRIYVIGDF